MEWNLEEHVFNLHLQDFLLKTKILRCIGSPEERRRWRRRYVFSFGKKFTHVFSWSLHVHVYHNYVNKISLVTHLLAHTFTYSLTRSLTRSHVHLKVLESVLLGIALTSLEFIISHTHINHDVHVLHEVSTFIYITTMWSRSLWLLTYSLTRSLKSLRERFVRNRTHVSWIHIIHSHKSQRTCLTWSLHVHISQLCVK